MKSFSLTGPIPIANQPGSDSLRAVGATFVSPALQRGEGGQITFSPVGTAQTRFPRIPALHADIRCPQSAKVKVVPSFESP